jgi:hypothetical protein
MMRRLVIFPFSRLACLSLTTSLTVLILFGCGGQETTQVEDTSGHGTKVSKNMEDFMKTKPYKNVGREKVQVK